MDTEIIVMSTEPHGGECKYLNCDHAFGADGGSVRIVGDIPVWAPKDIMVVAKGYASLCQRHFAEVAGPIMERSLRLLAEKLGERYREAHAAWLAGDILDEEAQARVQRALDAWKMVTQKRDALAHRGPTPFSDN